MCVSGVYIFLSLLNGISNTYIPNLCMYIYTKKTKKTQPFTGTLWFAVAVEVVVAALVLMYVEGYGTNEALPGKVLLRRC